MTGVGEPSDKMNQPQSKRILNLIQTRTFHWGIYEYGIHSYIYWEYIWKRDYFLTH